MELFDRAAASADRPAEKAPRQRSQHAELWRRCTLEAFEVRASPPLQCAMGATHAIAVRHCNSPALRGLRVGHGCGSLIKPRCIRTQQHARGAAKTADGAVRHLSCRLYMFATTWAGSTKPGDLQRRGNCLPIRMRACAQVQLGQTLPIEPRETCSRACGIAHCTTSCGGGGGAPAPLAGAVGPGRRLQAARGEGRSATQIAGVRAGAVMHTASTALVRAQPMCWQQCAPRRVTQRVLHGAIRFGRLSIVYRCACGHPTRSSNRSSPLCNGGSQICSLLNTHKTPLRNSTLSDVITAVASPAIAPP